MNKGWKWLVLAWCALFFGIASFLAFLNVFSDLALFENWSANYADSGWRYGSVRKLMALVGLITLGLCAGFAYLAHKAGRRDPLGIRK